MGSSRCWRLWTKPCCRNLRALSLQVSELALPRKSKTSLTNFFATLFVAMTLATLQVYFTWLAGELDASTLQLLPQRGLCPCCGSTPVSGLITASGEVPGTRYLYCSLCSTAWNHARAVCITCECSGTLSLKSIEGDDGAVKAETCDDCHTYAKMLYQAKDTQVDPYADDLATLGLDVMVAEAGWARHAPNPLLLIEQVDA